MKQQRLSIARKLALIQGLLVLALALVAAFAFQTLDRVAGTTARVAERYVPQLERISDVQMLMFRISLEARHAMLVKTPEERDATFQRIGKHRQEMLDKLKAFEENVTTPEGKVMLGKIRVADVLFWRLGGEVLAKVTAGDIDGAFGQLNGELVPARDQMVSLIKEQRTWQQSLVVKAVNQAEQSANQTKNVVLAVAVVSALLCAWLARSLAMMMRGAFTRAQSVTRRIAGGNLSDDIYVRDGDEFGSLFDSIVHMQNRLLGVVSNVRAVADRIGETAQSIDQVNGELARVADSQTQSVQGTTASTRSMNASVQQSAQSVERVSELAAEASRVAARGGEVVTGVVSTMRGIEDSSKRISEIVSVIDGIAFQTNILALNAAVEAARAGEQGRGFAVVAGEVRSLAQRCASAAREVKTLINDSVERVETGTGLVDQAGQTMQAIVQSVDQVSALMGDIALATRGQRADVESVTNAVGDIDAATLQSADAVRRSNAAAAALREHATELEAAVAAFNLDVVARPKALALN